MKCDKCDKDAVKEVATGHFRCASCGDEFLTSDSDFLKTVDRILDEDY